MDAARVDAILARIDAVIGPPESETDKEREDRRQMVAGVLKARAIRRAAET